MAVTITSVMPISGDNDALVPLTILGEGFVAGAAVFIGEYEGENVVVVSANYITVDVPVDIIPNMYDVTVTNLDATTDTLEDAFRATYPLPDPPFVGETYDNIVSRMLTQPGNWDKRNGSWYRDLINSAGFEIAKLYENMNILLQLSFPQTTYGGYLSTIGEQYGITRIPPVKATGSLTVLGDNGTIIPIGTLFSTSTDLYSSEDPVEFVSTAVATIAAGTATVAVQAKIGGTAGNVGAGSVDQIVDLVVGVTSVTNAAPFTGGAAQETDTVYRNRLLNRIRNPIAGGNAADYETWALEVDGVGAGHVIPLWNGPGTVKLIITDEAGQPALQAVLDAVKAYIDPTDGLGEGKAPIGATLTVVAPGTTNIDVTVTVSIATGYNGALVRAAVEDALEDFINGLVVGADVLYSAIASTIFNVAGVADYSSLTVNAGTANIVIAATSKAVPNTIAVS